VPPVGQRIEIEEQSMLIQSYELEITVSTHDVEEFEYEAIARLDADIRQVFPYLNAILARANYVPTRPSLAWRHKEHNIGFWPDRIAADGLDSREYAKEIIQWLVDLVNDTWARRDEIRPDHTTHRRRQPLELYRLFPQINCRACGAETCFAFALKLAAGQAELERCSPLFQDPSLAGNQAQLAALLASKWPTIEEDSFRVRSPSSPS
jgi:ArsR family metal-binding transcriptional regulator